MIPLDATQIYQINYVMFFLTPAKYQATILENMVERDLDSKLESFFILLALNGGMLIVLCLFSIRWSKQITRSVAILNNYTSKLKKAQDRIEKSNIVDCIAEHKDFQKIAKQYDANIR